MRLPSFSFMGGKSRIRKWLIRYFPREGNLYLEPFAGVGNVFYLAKTVLKFNKFQLNDIDISFFNSLRNADLNTLPDRVSREQFDYYKNVNNDISKIIESRITFGGKGYKHGFNGSKGINACQPYNGKLYKNLCENARELLKDIEITNKNWEDLKLEELGSDDFVYCDPPYLNTKASYPNIDHRKFIEVLNKCKCRWAISGYESEFYKTLNSKNKYVKERNSEIKSSNNKTYSGVNEMLWTNY